MADLQIWDVAKVVDVANARLADRTKVWGSDRTSGRISQLERVAVGSKVDPLIQYRLGAERGAESSEGRR